MGIPGSANPLLLAQQDTGYRVQRSIRLNSSDSAYLSRTPSSAGNRKTWTLSFWLKRGTLSGTEQHIFSNIASSLGAGFILCLSSANKLTVNDYMGSLQNASIVTTTAVFRDCSAWYHIHILYDTTQATAANRIRIFINGTEQTGFDAASYPTQNYDGYWNSTAFAAIGRIGNNNERYFDGYLAEIHFIDGQALTPSSFTEVSATTGQLIPKAYTGTYGTNGFKLDFADNSAATAAALGKDTSGNGNNWTPNNLSVTAGAGNDSLVDTPTSYGTDAGAGGEVRGNYATLNPLATGTTATLANGNLDFSSASVNAHRPSTVAIQSGKWYCEFLITGGASGGNNVPGIVGTTTPSFPGSNSTSYGYYGATGAVYTNSGVIATYATFTGGDVVSVAFDADSGKIWFAKNGTWQGSGNPGTGANPTATATLGTYFFAAGGSSSGAASCSVNFGQRPFAYTAPSGFKALVDTNLPAPVVAKPSTVFDTKLYTGNGSTQNITGLGFSPDFVWIKIRNTATSHQLCDTVRGTNKILYSDLTNAEFTDTDAITSFNSDGWTMGAEGGINANGNTYVAWTWDAGSSTVTNTQGSITSTVRANASAGFSIVTWTGDGAAEKTVGHGLNMAPKLYFVKRRDSTSNFVAFLTDMTTGFNPQPYMNLNGTAAAALASQPRPTSSVIYVQNVFDNISSATYVAYCFAPVAGHSGFGSYTGNGSADGPFIYTGFRPRWLMIKRSSSAEDWKIYDTARDTHNPSTAKLYANLSAAENGSSGETASTNTLDVLSNGFKLRTLNGGTNQSPETYVWAAFAEAPFQYARAR